MKKPFFANSESSHQSDRYNFEPNEVHFHTSGCWENPFFDSKIFSGCTFWRFEKNRICKNLCKYVTYWMLHTVCSTQFLMSDKSHMVHQRLLQTYKLEVKLVQTRHHYRSLDQNRFLVQGDFLKWLFRCSDFDVHFSKFVAEV